MSRLRDFSRRSILRLAAATFTGAVSRTAFAAPHTFSPEESDVAGRVITGPTTWSYRNYVINATILVGSLPVFSKENVGGACLALETAGHADAGLTGLQFVAGTWPDRVKGFNRFGATQEVVRQSHAAVTESAYLSFMSTCSEKGFTDGRRAVSYNGPESMYSIARGRSTAAGSTFELRHRPDAARCNWSNCMTLLHSIADWGPLPALRPVANTSAAALPTFLFATREALETKQPVVYYHNGDAYRLNALPGPADDHGRLARCFLSRVRDKQELEFRLWFKDNGESVFPVRIEFHPKSFLRLTLKVESSGQAPVLRPMLGQS